MIFCVEDDGGIRELMIYTLRASGFEAMGFSESGGLFEELKKQIPRLVMLDIMLPEEDGISVLKRLKANPSFAEIPVIMATAKGTEYDKVMGLDAGADDYLAKPFGMMEMVSRVRAVLRRAEKNPPSAMRRGLLEMNTAKHFVTSAGQQVELTLKEYEMLKLFMENPGLVFTREHLLQRVWGEDFLGETRTVDVHIGTLRTKLGVCGEYIETVRGVGYRMGERL
ncbi:MAG: response regulator transcription factor [Ruminococcus sp.]|nr:response regulator transcription factor [Ruminococcus sp.]MCM1480528.1 response regulator transcription factor [Muribaculaceae bacterium]